MNVNLSMLLFENRLNSFRKCWSLSTTKCTPINMARSGFYNVSTKYSPNNVKCVMCLKELGGWEEEDDPWEEHKKRGDECPFVKAMLEGRSLVTLDELIDMAADAYKSAVTLEYKKRKSYIDSSLSSLELE